MTADAPSIVIDVDVEGTEKIEEVAEATKKVDKAQKELAKAQRELIKQKKKLGKANKALADSFGKMDSGIGSLIGSYGRLAFATTPLFAAVAAVGLVMNSLTDTLLKNREVTAFQREKFAELTETAAAARTEFEALTTCIMENGEIMRKYGIQFDGTLAAMTAGVAGLSSTRYSANLHKNRGILAAQMGARLAGGMNKYDAAGLAQFRKEVRAAVSEDVLEQGKFVGGANFAPEGTKIPILDDIARGVEKFFTGMTDAQISMRNVFREAGYREGESKEGYTTRMKGLFEAENVEYARALRELRETGSVTSGVTSRGNFIPLNEKDLLAKIQENQGIMSVLTNGEGAWNGQKSSSPYAAMMMYLNGLDSYSDASKKKQLDETKKEIERAKKADAILNPKGKTKTTKQVPAGMWDTNSMGAIPYADTTKGAAKNTTINISNTIDVSGLDPNNLEAFTAAVSEQMGESLLAYVNPGGGFF